jgi:hypothetical protein
MTNPTEPTTQVTLTATVVYEEWPDGSRTARLSFWEEPPTVHAANGEWLTADEEEWHPAVDAARERMLRAFPDDEQPLPTLVMREVRA